MVTDSTSIMRYHTRVKSTGRLSRFVSRYPLTVFFLLAFGVSWTVWLGIAAGRSSESLGLLAVIPGAFGPPIATVVVLWLTEEDLWNQISEILRSRAPYQWYVIALVVPVVIVAIGTGGLFLLGHELVLDKLAPRLIMFLPTVVFMMLLGGGQEEFGWRGFALPRLERRLHPSVAALVLGVVWAIWHLPLFYLPGASQFGTSFVLYGIGVVGLSILFTWVFNRSASVIVLMLLHGSYNASLVLYPLPIERLTGAAASDVLTAGVIATWLVGVLVFILTSGELGYKRQPKIR